MHSVKGAACQVSQKNSGRVQETSKQLQQKQDDMKRFSPRTLDTTVETPNITVLIFHLDRPDGML